MILYIEKEIENDLRAQEMIQRCHPKKVITCERYTEIFNRKAQNFRLQKEAPAYIIAKKYGSFLHEIPKKFAIGAEKNFYFSHVLNCPFDCQYCYLQGMYRSAYYVLFINYEDFQEAIAKGPAGHYFSGYDGDSLALEPKTRFTEAFLPFFEKHPDKLLELRTKSLFIRPLLERKPIDNGVVAYSLSPESVAQEIEKKTPSLEKRLEAIQKLQKCGWKIGLRFDPIIYQKDFENLYRAFFQTVFAVIDHNLLHSVTLGAFRLPKPYFKNMQKNGSDKKLLAFLKEDAGEMHYLKEKELIAFCENEIRKYTEKVFTI